MADVVVTCPQRLWDSWVAEGDLPGEPPTGDEFIFSVAGGKPNIQPGERVYVVAHGKLRGYAPLVRLEPCVWLGHVGWGLIRASGAVAVTLLNSDDYATMSPAVARACGRPHPIRGFQGYRYRWWDRSMEIPFPGWRQP